MAASASRAIYKSNMRSGDGCQVRHRLGARVMVGGWWVERRTSVEATKVGIHPAEHLAGMGGTEKVILQQEQVSLGLLGLHPPPGLTWCKTCHLTPRHLPVTCASFIPSCTNLSESALTYLKSCLVKTDGDRLTTFFSFKSAFGEP